MAKLLDFLLPIVAVGAASFYYLGDTRGWFHDTPSTFYRHPKAFELQPIAHPQAPNFLIFWAQASLVAALLLVWRRLVKRALQPIGEHFGLKVGTKKMDKFKEQGWLALHYTMMFSIEYYVLSKKSWWPDRWVSRDYRIKMWENYPEEHILDQDDMGLRIAYTIQLAFYTMSLFLLFAEKVFMRSDFMEYLVHHCVTIALMSFSWVAYFHRIGSLVLILHDVGDIFLSLAKCLNYIKKEFLCNLSFVMFVILFIYPRLYVFPMLNFSCAYEFGQFIEPHFRGVNLASLLLVLQPLHVFWFILILRMIFRLITGRMDEGDVRSDDEGDDAPADSRPRTRSQSKARTKKVD